MTTTITPKELHDRARSGAIQLIDVRTPAEYRSIHVTGAVNLPLDQLDPATLPTGTVYLICQSGGRSRKACERLRTGGRSEVIDVVGGTTAWEAAGLPVTRGRGVISLERQVRIAAGILVLTGVALGFLAHPIGFGLSAFVGAGLVFAGLTNTCGMGMLLAKMPWNTRTPGCTT